MNDFYTILINSLKKRDLWDRSEREKLYDHARMAMIQKLWAMRPDLASGEVQERIRQFEAAVKQVESDVTVAERFRQFGPGDTPAAIAYVPSEPEPEGRWNGATMDGPLLEGTVVQPEPEFDFKLQLRREVEEETEPEWEPDPPAYAQQTLALPAPQPRRTFRRHQPRQLGEEDDVYDAADEPLDQRSWAESAPDWRTGVADDEDELAAEADPTATGAATAKGKRGLAALSMDRLFQLGAAKGDRWEGPKPLERGNDLHRIRGYLDRSIRKLSGGRLEGGYGQRPPSPAEPKGRASRYVTAGIIALGACFVLWGMFAVVPLLLRGGDVVTERSGEDGRAIAAEAPPEPARSSTNAQPAAGRTPPTTTTTVAVTTPTKLASLPVQERIPLFDGRNPTAFTASPDNPIRYTGDGKGGFARVASSSSSPGAKLVVGPGVAQRLAGKVIRITVEVRASSEQAATTMRIGYQAGAQVSPWKAGPIGKGFSTIDLTWQVPPGAGRSNNVVLIEPGIPGSGTAVEIRSVTLEVLKSG